jgi:hypothetical protein
MGDREMEPNEEVTLPEEDSNESDYNLLEADISDDESSVRGSEER